MFDFKKLFLFLYLSTALVPLHALLIPAGKSIQKTIDENPKEVNFKLEQGRYLGNIKIERTLNLVGNGKSTIQSLGRGTTVSIEAPDVTLSGVIIDGSGARYDQTDAAILVKSANAKVLNCIVTNATFGIVSNKSQKVSIVGNTVYGNADTPLGLRGDGIRIWETTHSTIMSNRLINSRDMLVWYASSNQFVHNQVEGGRYGVHFMYSHYNYLEGNRFISNVVGAFMMYSRHITAKKNIFSGTSGPSGYGLGLKESGGIHFVSNSFVGNTYGIYSDNAPYDERFQNLFEYNLIALSDFGVVFHGQPKRNVFRFNTLKKNRIQVQSSGQNSTTDAVWRNNYFDDYKGYDLDHNSKGDLPYEYRRLMNDLTEKYPPLLFFDGTLAYYLINLIGEALPLLKPRLIVIDEDPLSQPSLNQLSTTP